MESENMFPENEYLRKENESLKQQLDALLKAIEKLTTLQTQQHQLNRIKIDQLLANKITEGKTRELSKGQLENYQRARQLFLKYSNNRGLTHADEVTEDHALEFYEYLKNAPSDKTKTGKLSKTTAIHMQKCIKATFEYALHRNQIHSNPFPNINIPLKPIIHVWTDEYLETLITAIHRDKSIREPHKLETICRTLYTTGLRIGLFLRTKNKGLVIDGDKLIIKTKRKDRANASIIEHATEIINNRAKEMLLTYYKPNKPEDKLINTDKNNTARKLKRICTNAGIPYLSPHKAKHGLVTKLLKKGRTAEQICKYTGNKTPALINKVYNHLTYGDIREQLLKDLE